MEKKLTIHDIAELSGAAKGFPLFEWGKRPGGNRAEEKEGHRGVPYGKQFSNML